MPATEIKHLALTPSEVTAMIEGNRIEQARQHAALEALVGAGVVIELSDRRSPVDIARDLGIKVVGLEVEVLE